MKVRLRSHSPRHRHLQHKRRITHTNRLGTATRAHPDPIAQSTAPGEVSPQLCTFSGAHKLFWRQQTPLLQHFFFQLQNNLMLLLKLSISPETLKNQTTQKHKICSRFPQSPTTSAVCDPVLLTVYLQHIFAAIIHLTTKRGSEPLPFPPPQRKPLFNPLHSLSF